MVGGGFSLSSTTSYCNFFFRIYFVLVLPTYLDTTHYCHNARDKTSLGTIERRRGFTDRRVAKTKLTYASRKRKVNEDDPTPEDFAMAFAASESTAATQID